LGDPNRFRAAVGGGRREDRFGRLSGGQGGQGLRPQHAGQGAQGLAFTFFKPASVADGKISGQAYRKGTTGAPLLEAAPGALECKVTSIVEQGDHHIVVGEVVEAHLPKPFTGRPDAAILEMKELGDNVFYGG
jgi:flavin reductase (DIM6/NTAB) family NADH-FMN oxidoreductase RutF